MLKISFTVLFINFICIGNCIAQQFRANQVKLYQSLIDEVYLLTLFVDTEVDYWEDDEIDYYLEELEKSQSWIYDQAFQYQKSLEFINDYFSDSNELIYLKNLNYIQLRHLLPDIMSELGYDDFNSFLDRNSFDFERQKLKILLFVKNNSRSHAYNYWSNESVDIAIVYCKHTSGTYTDKYVIAHELLHQFGAWDLYYGESQNRENAVSASALYPYSIMGNTFSNKSKLNVDKLTSWRIGWHNNVEEEFMTFDPKLRSREEFRKEQREMKDQKTIKFDLKKKKKNN